MMEDMFEYPVQLEVAVEGGYVVSFPDIPEALTQGEDKDEALVRAKDALETALEFYVEAGEDLPRPSKPSRRQHVVTPPAIACMKLGIYVAMRAQHVRKTDLAKRLGCHLMQIDRLLDLHHNSRVDQLEAALGALGRKLHIRVGEAA